MPGLAPALDTGGVLVGYRVGRRAVVRHGPGWFKVVRPKRVGELVAVHEFAGDAVELATPTVLVAHDDGRVELSSVAGPSLNDVIRCEPGSVSSVLPSVAEALAVLHRSPRFGPDRRPDPPSRSLRIVERGEPEVLGPFLAGAECLPPLDGGTPATVHGDLHDKNVMVSGRHVGLIDLDGLGWGVAEDDVANLAVHLELRALQLGLATTWVRDLIAAYPSPLDARRLEAARRHTWFRLAALYRFREPGRRLSDELYRRALTVSGGR